MTDCKEGLPSQSNLPDPLSHSAPCGVQGGFPASDEHLWGYPDSIKWTGGVCTTLMSEIKHLSLSLAVPAQSRWGGRGWCPPSPRPRPVSPSPPAPGSGSGPCSSPTAGTWRPRCPPALAPESRPETESSDQSAEQREHRVCLLKLKRERYGAPPNNKIWNLIWFIFFAKSQHPSEDIKQSSWG